MTKRWVWIGLFSSALALALAWPGTSESAIPMVDSAIGAGIDAALNAAGHSGIEAFQPWKPSPDPLARRRVERAVDAIRHFGRTASDPWRWETAPSIVITEGLAGEPNALCTGSTIYVSASLIKVLNDRQLRAVIAHEMAHAEQGHLTERMSHAPAALLLQFGRLVRSDWRALTRGEIDDFMRELWRDGHWKMIQEMLMNATLGQEMEADCYAAQWLETMQQRGVDQDPSDLVASLLELLQISRDSLNYDTFNGARASLIESEVWRTSRCGG